MKFTEEFKLIRSILFTYLTYFFSDILYKISVFLIENVSLKRNESFLLNKIINNLLTKMFFCAALVLLFIIKLRFPKGKNIHHIRCFFFDAIIFDGTGTLVYYNKDRRVFIYFIYLFRVTLSVISTGENSCPPYCGYRFNYLRK